ncbi:TonB-dependent receptor [Limibacter armeniacum]|uniref:SusC/RagA family TonB-linked outer membrane protein n=1 Tax=Limibacter armeniacum TaxID=466084 RepID=UPI002FE62D29
MKLYRYLVFLLALICCIKGSSAYAQGEKIVKGTIKSVTGELLIGVTVAEEGTTSGTISDLNGEFKLAVSEGATLKVSYIGYQTQTVEVKNRSFIEVILDEDVQQLQELVVVGYGTMRKDDLTGAVTSVKAENIKANAGASLDQALQGMAAGVQVTQSSGQPGASTSIRIRGITSINGSNEPLYVIDGVPIITSSGDMSTGATKSASLNPLASINPNDIASIEILKDVSQTAIYGARAANGVIVVTTKKGKTGKTVISFDSYAGVQQVSKKMEMLNAQQLAELGNEATDNAGLPRRPIFASPLSLGEGTNWQNEIFQQAAIQSYQLSVSGGDQATRFSVSGGYFTQDGIIIGSDYVRGNIRTSLDHRINEKFKIGTNLTYARTISNGVVTATGEGGIGGSGVVTSALSFNPALSVMDASGEYTYKDNLTSAAPGNPVVDALKNLNHSQNNRFIGSLYADYQILDGLSFKTSVSGDAYFNKEMQFIPNDIRRGEQSGGQATHGLIYGYTWLWENVASYIKQLNDANRVNFVAGYSMQSFNSEATIASTSDFDDNRLTYHALQAGKMKGLTLSASNAWQMQSYFGRLNYSLNNRYIFTATGRVDGSSKFGKNNKYGFFPSAALAWRVSEETFFDGIESINELKFRSSYGITGNQGIPAYSAQGRLEQTTAYLNNQETISGAGPISLANQDLKWEKTKQFNIGMDMGLFDDRVQITADYYQKYTSDLLLNTPMPYYSGFKSAYMNVGDMENTGIELTLSGFVADTEKFQWKSDFNISRNTNVVTDLGELGEDGIPSEPMLGITGWSRISEGKPIGTYYGYITDGIFQLNDNLDNAPYFTGAKPEAGDRKYKDLNGDGVIDSKDITEIGNATPDFIFGFTNTFKYKRFTLMVNTQGSVGNDLVNFNKFNLENLSGTTNASSAVLDRWTPENPTNDMPKADATPPTNVLSSAQVEDGSYWRIKNLKLGYDLPENITNKAGMTSFHVYASVQNLYTLTNYTGFDPEVNMFSSVTSMGADYGSYPTARTFLIGANITF